MIVDMQLGQGSCPCLANSAATEPLTKHKQIAAASGTAIADAARCADPYIGIDDTIVQ
jgi:hypothetical protein